jgi:hypothetical protein
MTVHSCDGCGRVFAGTTNRRARRPLDPRAVAVANAHVDASCPRLAQPDGSSRLLTMARDDYTCRRVWMNKYLETLEQGEQSDDSIEPKRSVDPVAPVAQCSAGGSTTGGKVDAGVDCAIVEISAQCSHGGKQLRRVTSERILEVVPDASLGADRITLEATMQRACGNHPVWSITGKEGGRGSKHQFDAYPPVISKLWLIQVSPRVYEVDCDAHACPRRLTIHAYPSDELAINVDLNKTLKALRNITKVAEVLLDTVADRFQWKYLEGRVSAQAAWKEHTDHRAFYAYVIAAKLDPLFGAEFKVTVGPSKITKWASKIPLAGKYVERVIGWLVKAGVYFKVAGGITVDVSYKRNSPDQQRFVKGIGPGLGGSIGVAVGAEGRVVGDLLKVELELGGAIKAASTPFIDGRGFGLDSFQVDFDGLKGTIKAIFLWGVIDANETMTLVGASTLYGPERLYFYEA